MDFSFILPILNEEGSLPVLYDEIVAVMRDLGATYELIFIDDGSSDRSVEIVRSLAQRDDSVRVIEFSRNFGKSAAYTAGFAAATGQRIVTMDGDLQDDPAELPKLLAKLDEGNDLVIGWKMHRMGNEPSKTLPSRLFNGLNRLLFGVSFRDQNSGYRVMHLEVARVLELTGDHYRFIPQLAHIAGFRVDEVGVVHRKRRFGVSKYGVTRFWTGLLDLLTVRFLTRYQGKPLHFFGTVGLAPILLGLGLEVYVLVMKLVGHTFQEHIAALIIGVMMILMGAQSIVIGLIGEMLIAPPRARYTVVGEGERRVR